MCSDHKKYCANYYISGHLYHFLHRRKKCNFIFLFLGCRIRQLFSYYFHFYIILFILKILLVNICKKVVKSNNQNYEKIFSRFCGWDTKIYNEKIHHTINGHLDYIFHQKNKERITSPCSELVDCIWINWIVMQICTVQCVRIITISVLVTNYLITSLK